MKENVLLKLAVACAVLGLVSLFFISESIDVNEISLKEVNEKDEGSDVKIKGIVSRISEGNKTIYLEVSQLQNIGVVLFKDDKVDLHEGDYVEIAGSVEDYKGRKEIIGSVVKVVR